MNPSEMTLDQIRDWFYRRKALLEIGKDIHSATDWAWAVSMWDTAHCRFLDKSSVITHPIPATLDAIAGLMPRNLTWLRLRYIDDTGCWIALPKDGACRPCEAARVPDTGDELLDRARLAMYATLAEDKAKENRI